MQRLVRVRKAEATILQIPCYPSLGICFPLLLSLLLIRFFSCHSQAYWRALLACLRIASIRRNVDLRQTGS